MDLVTEVRMHFSVHSIMLTGSPKYMEPQLFLDPVSAASSHRPPASITLPQQCHTNLVDRLVPILYTKDYDNLLPNKGRTTLEIINILINALFIPLKRSSVREAAILTGSLDHNFHLHMYALGELLQYESLKTAARTKLLNFLNESLQQPTLASLGNLADCVNSCFAPHSSLDRWCIDEDGAMQQMIVAAVLHGENTS